MNQSYKEVADKHKQFKQYQVGDWIMIFLQEKRFPIDTYHKLKRKKIGPCKVLCKLGEKAYEVGLPVS